MAACAVTKPPMWAQGQPHPGEVRAGTLVRYRVFHRETEHLRSLVDQQSAKSKRGTGSQRWRKDALRFVGAAGHRQAALRLKRGAL